MLWDAVSCRIEQIPDFAAVQLGEPDSRFNAGEPASGFPRYNSPVSLVAQVGRYLLLRISGRLPVRPERRGLPLRQGGTGILCSVRRYPPFRIS